MIWNNHLASQRTKTVEMWTFWIRTWRHREFSSNTLSRISRKLARMKQMRIYIVNETAKRSRALDEHSRENGASGSASVE